MLAREFPDVVPGILTGVSAGGINAAYLAARQEPFADKVENLANVWCGLHIDDVFRVDLRDLASRLVRWGGRLVSGGRVSLPPSRSLVDTAPLRELLGRLLQADGRGHRRHRPQPGRRLAARHRADGVELHDRPVDDVGPGARRLRHPAPGSGRSARASTCEFRVDHVMASAALPFFFPAIEVDGAWYGDGGIRLTAPLSPAVHLGARRIIAVSTRYARSREEADRPAVSGYPPPAQVAGVLYNAIFLDQLDADALQLQQINALVGAPAGGSARRAAAHRSADAAAVDGSGTAGQRIRAGAAARVPVSRRAASARARRGRTTCSAW